MVDFELVKRVAKTLGMSEQEVMNTQFVELIESLVDENEKKDDQYDTLFKNSLGYPQNYKQINEYCKEAHEIAKSKGWYENPSEIGTILALVHSEVSEALEAIRKSDWDNFVEELADICIRVFDLCGYLDINLGQAIDNKMEKNRFRSYRHGGKAF